MGGFFWGGGGEGEGCCEYYFKNIEILNFFEYYQFFFNN